MHKTCLLLISSAVLSGIILLSQGPANLLKRRYAFFGIL